MPRHREIDYGDPYAERTPKQSQTSSSSSKKKKKKRPTRDPDDVEEQHQTPTGYNPSRYTNPNDPTVNPLPASNDKGYDDDDDGERKISLKMMIGIGICCILVLIGLIVAVAVVLNGGDDSGDNTGLTNFAGPTAPPRPPPTFAPTPAPITAAPVANLPTPIPSTLLPQIRQRGFLNCGVPDQPGFAAFNIELGDYEGFDVDMCRAVAAGIFGEADGRVKYQVLSASQRWLALANEEIDMLSRVTTHTMQRHVLEPTTKRGYSFSVPYLYNGLVFGGLPANVQCADDFNSAGACNSTVICTREGTTHQAEITSKAPNMKVLSVDDLDGMYNSFFNGFCNVVSGEQSDVAESLIRSFGYEGEYAIGSKVHSKEPLCTVTRDDDPEFSDFVGWIMQALLVAEEEGITDRTANILGTTDVFGDDYRRMFINAVEVVGNYGDIYRRHLEAIIPRAVGDSINPGDSGLIYSFPYGNVNEIGDGPIAGGTLEAIRDRGFLRCGISTRLIFANFDEATETWSGFDVDFCRAIAAAIFDGDATKVEFFDLSASARFVELASGGVDVLSRLTTVTLSRDVLEPNAGVGFTFTQPNFYDGMTFGGLPTFTDCADRLDVTSTACRDLLLCVTEDTTFETRLRALFPTRFLVTQDSLTDSINALNSGECNVVAGGVVDVSLTNIRNIGYVGEYKTGSNRFSKDPLALVTRQDDQQWSKFVFWIVSSIFYAEEQGITQSIPGEMPRVSLFGPLFFEMLQNAIAAVGNYAEIYERNAEAEVPRGGLNSLNEALSGPQHYPLPGIV